MAKLKVGVIGAGSISSSHLHAYSVHPEVELTAIADMNGERAQEKAAAYGIPHVYDNYIELLTNPDIDAVSICTWNNSHAEIAVSALLAGKHVLCEKPLAQTVEQALTVQEAVKRSGKLLLVGFVRRYADQAQLVKQYAESGQLGEIYYAKASAIRRLGNPGGWFSDATRSGGGPLIDIGVHMIDLCWYLMGKPKPVSVSGNTYRKLGNRSHIEGLSFYKAADYNASLNDVEDMANALIRFENGASLYVDISYTLHAAQNEMSSKIYGTKGGAELDPKLVIVTEQFNKIVNIEPQLDHLDFQFQDSFNQEIAHFVDCCFGKAEPISPVEDGVELMRMLEAVYQSSALGAEVILESDAVSEAAAAMKEGV
ncbi:Gfo/Idh/MocA family protein [Paenibacillus sp. YAF4_2]|uniref:Gfo/Idh/MocA family protein n=1 Tax=Paenibacillus sp. YAF4_2 TaxID=3233085 RepID=UPI003F9DF762